MSDYEHDSSRWSERRAERLAERLHDAAPDRFAVGFTGRVTERLARERALLPERTADFTAALERHFVRIVPMLAAASLVLALYSWWGGRANADSLLDATLNLPQASIATVYSSDAFYAEDGGDN